MKTIYLLSLAGLVWLNGPSPLLAQQPTSSPSSQGASSDNAPRTSGAGTRTGEERLSCTTSTDTDSPQLMALVPQTDVILTTQERVNLYIYLPPETPQTSKSAVLEVIELDNKKTIWEADFELNTANAIARLVLPETIQFAPHNTADLSPGNTYEWRLSIYCNSDEVVDIVVTGWINRLIPEVSETSLNLWHDELETSFDERTTNPAAWQQSLAAEKLANYADFDVETYILESQTHSSATGEF